MYVVWVILCILCLFATGHLDSWLQYLLASYVAVAGSGNDSLAVSYKGRYWGQHGPRKSMMLTAVGRSKSRGDKKAEVCKELCKAWKNVMGCRQWPLGSMAVKEDGLWYLVYCWSRIGWAWVGLSSGRVCWGCIKNKILDRGPGRGKRNWTNIGGWAQ